MSKKLQLLHRLEQTQTPPIDWPARHVVGPDEITPAPFHLGQTWAWESERRYTAMFAGTQGGKTGYGPWWLAREIERLGGGDYLAVTAVYDLFKLKLLPALLRVFVDILRIGRYWGGDRLIELRDPETKEFRAKRSTDPMWGRIILRSADAEGGLEAATAKAAWLDEAGQDRFSLAAWRGIQRRIALHQGRVLVTTTLYNLGWVKSEFIDLATDGGEVTLEVLDTGAEVERTDNAEADVCLIQFDSIANPAYPLAEYQRAQATMPDDEFAMFWRGRVAKLRTLIYDCFDEDIHKVKPFPIPAHWPRVVGIDPLGEYIAAVWLAFDPDKTQLHAYREYYEPFGETTPGHVAAIDKFSQNERVGLWVGGGPSERQARADWQGAGIPLLEPPFGDVWVGISRVYELFKDVALVIHSNCEHLLDELGSYQRQRDKAGNTTEKIKDKTRFHMLDSLRYICAWLTEPREEGGLVYMPTRIGPNW